MKQQIEVLRASKRSDLEDTIRRLKRFRVTNVKVTIVGEHGRFGIMRMFALMISADDYARIYGGLDSEERLA